ncbi:hypothetical protein ACHAXN_006043 [Cyclotella atomus]
MAKAHRSQPEFLQHACIATRLLDGRRQLFDLKERFNEAKAEYDLSENDYQRRDLEFQANLVKYEAFSKKNESAYLRATKRLAEEIRLCEEKDEETGQLIKLLDEKRAEEQNLLALIGKRRRYHDALAKGSDALDILSHFDQLKQTNESTRQRQKEVEMEISSRKEQLESLLKKHDLSDNSVAVTNPQKHLEESARETDQGEG